MVATEKTMRPIILIRRRDKGSRVILNVGHREFPMWMLRIFASVAAKMQERGQASIASNLKPYGYATRFRGQRSSGPDLFVDLGEIVLFCVYLVQQLPNCGSAMVQRVLSRGANRVSRKVFPQERILDQPAN